MRQSRCFSVFLMVLLLLPGLIYAQEKLPENVMTEKGIAEFRAENYEEAVQIFMKTREQYPGSSIAAYYLGRSYVETGNYDAAVLNLKDAVTLAPPVKDAYADLIEVFYSRDDLREARKWLEKAEKEDVKSGRIALIKGKILVKDGRNTEAVKTLKKAKELDSTLYQSADFEIANAYAIERRIPEAKASLRAVIAADPSSELAIFAKEYEEALSKSAVAQKTWRSSIGIAYQYDDNVVLQPSSSIGSTAADDISGRSDSSMVNTFRTTYQPVLKDGWLFNAQYSLYSNTYSSSFKYDTLNSSLTLSPGFDLIRTAVSLPLNYSHTWVNERQYSVVLSAKPTLSFKLRPNHMLQISAGFATRNMMTDVTEEEDRDAKIYSLAGAYLYRFCQGKGFFRLTYEHSAEDADGINWDSRGQRIGAGLLVPIKDKLSLLLSGETYTQRFINYNSRTGAGAPSGFPDTESRRKDDVYTFVAGMIWDIKKNLAINLQYLHINNGSNFSIYDYSRNAYTAGIEYRF